MKKYLLSIFTIGLFGVFLGYQKVQSVEGRVANSTTLDVGSSSNQSPANPLVSFDAPVNKVAGGASNPVASPVVVTNSGNRTSQTSVPATKPAPTPTTVSKYKDGTYTGISADAYYGYIQVEAIIQNGQITDVIFLDHPNDQSESRLINNYAMPRLKSEAISVQSANVAIVSRATDSSLAFRQSLASALSSALN